MKELTTAKGTKLPLLNLKGKDYLQVAYRLVWFREEHSDWRIQTDFVSLNDTHAVARACIINKDGHTLAIAHKREDKAHFPDFMEKAETGAIGRALALCGYGTQFEPELDEGNRIVDSPLGGSPVTPDQPDPSEGVQNLDRGYVIDFGKWNKKTLEQVMRDEGPDAIADYISYLIDSAKKQNKPIMGKVEEFIKRAEDFLGAFENSSLLQDPNPNEKDVPF